ncbi:Mss4-like protein [Roridomyces roridus]|uniref:Mss4-like protein n=1 Tax=Roridomyces roridus TaxID=1738132 RepID=A0AAD7FS31_9AGAR|nr:Mss4-like protein [Roridomyces roridus]
MSEVEYRGNCHCGAFKYTFKAPEIKANHVCNCSICVKISYLWTFADNIVVVKGDIDTTLRDYEFANHTIKFKFCLTCGSSVLTAKSDGRFAINMRTLHDFDATKLPVGSTNNSAPKDPPYKVPEPVKVDTVPDGTTVYQGSCHCGAVRYAAFLSPETLSEVGQCNCSICHKNGVLWVYPSVSQVIFEGLDSVTEYTFGYKWRRQKFCRVCGVTLAETFTREGPEPETEMGLNARTINGLNLDKLKLTMLDGKADLPAYDAGW